MFQNHGVKAGGQVTIREVEAGGSSRESGREPQLARTPRVLLGRCRPCARGYRERELQLTRAPWVLLGPQLSEHVWDPAVDRSELVQARMIPPAEGDQGGGEIRGPTVVDHERVAGHGRLDRGGGRAPGSLPCGRRSGGVRPFPHGRATNARVSLRTHPRSTANRD